MNRVLEVLTRKKILDADTINETPLARVLNFFDLTALGIGSTLGVGVYVLAGHVAKEVAGPAVILSFLIAAVASVFAGLCYAEFGSRVPKAGSAYVYSYVCIGELVAFVIGWNLILEYVIGSASVAKGLSLYLDTLINNTMQDTFKEIAPIHIKFLATYFDFFSFGISLVLAAALAFGMKGSATINNIFTAVNLSVVFFVVVAGSFKANLSNWSLPAPPDPKDGTGGFFPFGASGVIQGAATCFYGFVGFDCIATTGEEVKNPQKAIPFAIITSLAVIFLAYFGTATVVTLMVPYYLQDINAPLPHAFTVVGWEVGKWIVTIGGIFGLCASLFGAMFPLPRVLYAMATDGIIFKFLGNVNARFQTPLIGTLLAGLLTGVMAGLFDLKHLVNMMSIGTLLAYTIVAACVLVLRYSVDENRQYDALPTQSDSDTDGYASNDNLVHSVNTEKITISSLIKQSFNLKFLRLPTKTSQTVVSIQICNFAILSVTLWLCVIYLENEIKNAQTWVIVLISLIGLLLILSAMSMAAQPNSQTVLNFKVPLVPLIPLLSILANIYLMLMLDFHTWIRFGVWMAVGLPVYFISVRCDDSLNNNKMHAKVNGHILHNSVITNGRSNNNFIVDEKHGINKTTNAQAPEELAKVVASSLASNKNLKPKAPLPPIVSLPERNPPLDALSVSGALAALDDVLVKEDLVTSSRFLLENPFNRKISIDTVSNASNVHNEESVVALIHREDINHDFDHPPPILEEATDAESDSSTNDKDISIESKTNVPVPPLCPPSGYLTSPRMKVSKDETVTPKILRSQSIHGTKWHETNIPPPPPSMDNFTHFLRKSNKFAQKEPSPSLIRSKSEPEFMVGDTPPPPPPSMDDFTQFLRKTNKLGQNEPPPSLIRSKSEPEFMVGGTPPPPPPPSMDNFTQFLRKSPKLAQKEPAPSLIRSKSEPEFAVSHTPLVLSRQESEESDISDNVPMSGKKYEKVAAKLNDLFKRRSLGLQIKSKLTKPDRQSQDFPQPVSPAPGLRRVLDELPKKKSKKENENGSNDTSGVVIEETLKPADIKKKLNEIFRSDPRLTVRLSKSNIAVSELNEEFKEKYADLGDDQKTNEKQIDDERKARLSHKSLMSSTLKSIKLRKTDSIIM
ncbi:hypothetical protein FQR65_LT10243 [Abscondita terminalis]|nr:hypothetical protein FQR65_LT10243 [Abscondita terminalis]